MVVSGIVLLLLVIVLALIIGTASATKVNFKEGGDLMIKNVFIYLVLFATLMMTIGGSVGVFMAVADIIAPAPYHQSFEEYKQWGFDKASGEKENTSEKVNLSDAELKARYDAMVIAEKDRQVSRAKNSLIKSLGWIIIPLPVFVFFQRRLSAKEA